MNYWCNLCACYVDDDGYCLCQDLEDDEIQRIMINDVVLTGRAAKAFLDAINNPPEPNQALKDLFHVKDKTDNKD